MLTISTLNGFIKKVAILLPSFAILGSLILQPIHAAALVSNPTPTAKVSFTFDDGLESAITQAAPTLAKYGLTGTNYVISGCVGMTTTPNTCRANTEAKYMSWAQLTSLQNTYGWEIGSHTATHPYLATKDATDGQPKVLTPAQVAAELVNSKRTLGVHGINATSFSSPYGDYNNDTLAQIAKVYASHRGFADQKTNDWPYNDYLLNNKQVQAGVTVAQVKSYIDTAIAGKQWLVLTMHDIKTLASTNPDDYEYKTSDLDQIASYVKLKQSAGLIQSVHVNQGPVRSDANMLANGSFNSGIGGGWTTDSPATITKDSASHGNYPDATNSIKLVASTKEAHLFSPRVTVSAGTSYMLKSFLNVSKITSGEVGYYIDEYDANGNWVSGQYKKAERSAFVESINFGYTPTSTKVVKASLQLIVTANSGITAYFDNVQWFVSQIGTVPGQTNLITNGAFDNGLTGWNNDNGSAIALDTANNGSPANPQNSVKLGTTTAKNAHLFSTPVTVSATKSYTISSYLNVKQTSGGVVGYYIDEYDANGNWVSGQYKTSVSTVGMFTIGFQYQPTSATVAKASLQVIDSISTNTLAYVDNVEWFAN